MPRQISTDTRLAQPNAAREGKTLQTHLIGRDPDFVRLLVGLLLDELHHLHIVGNQISVAIPSAKRSKSRTPMDTRGQSPP
eukprot:5320953-Pyramimonas_sp.AAC.1